MPALRFTLFRYVSLAFDTAFFRLSHIIFASSKISKYSQGTRYSDTDLADLTFRTALLVKAKRPPHKLQKRGTFAVFLRRVSSSNFDLYLQLYFDLDLKDYSRRLKFIDGTSITTNTHICRRRLYALSR